MQQTGQAGSFRAPQNRADLEALIAQRNELQGQLRAFEDRRFTLAEQRRSLEGTPQTVELDRRIKSVDADVARVERQLAQANELILAGHARFGGGQMELLPPGIPVPIGGDVRIEPGIAVPPSFPLPPGTDIGRGLLLGGGVGFLLLGALAWVWAVRRLERRLSRGTAGDPGNMTRLQQSVDAIALEVERISENQRWVTKQMNERGLGAGDAQPINVGTAHPEQVRRER